MELCVKMGGRGGADKTLSAVRIRLPNYYFTKYVLVKARICTKYMYIVVCICEPAGGGKRTALSGCKL